MIKTDLGNVNILVNGQNFNNCSFELPNKGKQYEVDGRFKIVIENILDKENTVIECILQTQNDVPLNAYAESGEELALISFIINDMKLSIGVRGDIPGVYYDYLNDGLRIRITKNATIPKLDIYIAWVTMMIEKEEIYTWFAADPTLGELRPTNY